VTSQVDDALVRSPYPRFKGKTLDEIAATSEGLLYLDWLVGWMEDQTLHNSQIQFYKSLQRYLARPEISRAVDDAIENRSIRKDDDVPGAWHPPGANKPWWEK
jgi:hypothetical protein